ncbi:HNH endonuclease [Thalassospira alkalitolerans]|uniref:Uncharacterized protein n=1 Tax=Thalassospira alkalitolerans TaxID=1293890 RepID=A0A1Y2L9Z2_9PROT|nr:HNH endonuclease [Thalassospira alkalitolerans]OSQ47364.1 hypothetical protein TALK_12445 [Thalassospira alkalitolerans]
MTKVGDLDGGLTAAKADWLPGTTWIGFTPTGKGVSAIPQCESTIQRQFSHGWIIEYITETFHNPNVGYEDDPDYVKTLARHEKLKGRLIAVHKLRYTSRPLKSIIGEDEYKHLQDMWDQDGQRRRWSVAFPIVGTYRISGTPKAKDVLDEPTYRRLFARSSATLRAINDDERALFEGLELEHQDAPNAHVAIDDEIQLAEKSDIDRTSIHLIERDLTDRALEGFPIERRIKLRKRAAWIADSFVRSRRSQGTLLCDQCGFDPRSIFPNIKLKARALLDVHHKNPIAEGIRYTSHKDFTLLCPTCHRVEHVKLKLKKFDN